MKRVELFLAVPLYKLGWTFLKIGLVFFGGGFVVIPVMHRELVLNQGWLTERQFIDGTALSQLTPGPVAVLATFAGYRVDGVMGGLVATIAAFLPGCLLMILLSHGYEIIKELEAARRVLSVLVPVVAGLLLAAAWLLGRTGVESIYGVIAFVVALVALIRFRIHPAVLIGIAAVLGLVLHL